MTVLGKNYVFCRPAWGHDHHRRHTQAAGGHDPSHNLIYKTHNFRGENQFFPPSWIHLSIQTQTHTLSFFLHPVDPLSILYTLSLPTFFPSLLPFSLLPTTRLSLSPFPFFIHSSIPDTLFIHSFHPSFCPTNQVIPYSPLHSVNPSSMRSSIPCTLSSYFLFLPFSIHLSLTSSSILSSSSQPFLTLIPEWWGWMDGLRKEGKSHRLVDYIRTCLLTSSPQLVVAKRPQGHAGTYPSHPTSIHPSLLSSFPILSLSRAPSLRSIHPSISSLLFFFFQFKPSPWRDFNKE